MSRAIGSIMLQCAQGKCVLVEILSFREQDLDKISTSAIVREIAEEFVPERIVAQVLNYGATVHVCMRLAQLLRGSPRESFQKKRFEVGLPRGIDQRFMCEDGIAKRYPAERQDQCRHNERA